MLGLTGPNSRGCRPKRAGDAKWYLPTGGTAIQCETGDVACQSIRL